MSVEKFKVTKDDSGYTPLPNSVLQNLHNLEALGLWCYFQSMPSEWEFQHFQIKNIFNIGRDKLEKLLRILKSHNLIKTTQNRAKGKFIEWELHVKDGKKFIPCPENTGTVHRALKNRALVNRALVNSTLIKETKKKKKQIKKTTNKQTKSSLVVFSGFADLSQSEKRMILDERQKLRKEKR